MSIGTMSGQPISVVPQYFFVVAFRSIPDSQRSNVLSTKSLALHRFSAARKRSALCDLVHMVRDTLLL